MGDRNSAHSFIAEPSLFARNLPFNIEYFHLSQMFKDFSFTRISLTESYQRLRSDTNENWIRLRREPGSQSGQIDFPDTAKAEKALAILNGRLIPGILPPASLRLSTTPDAASPALNATGNPRFVKLLPPNTTEIELYELIRPFGALIAARVDERLGGIVRFWTEGEARAAERAVSSTFSETTRITLQAYDPCILFCMNLSRDVDAAILRDHFHDCGSITSARVVYESNGQSRGYGFVSFFAPEEASYAINRHDGAIWRSNTLILRHYEPELTSEVREEEHVRPKASELPLDDAAHYQGPDTSTIGQTVSLETHLADVAALKDQTREEREIHQSTKRKLERMKQKREEAEGAANAAEAALNELKSHCESLSGRHKCAMDDLNAKMDAIRDDRNIFKSLLEKAKADRAQTFAQLQAQEQRLKDMALQEAWTNATIAEDERCRERDARLCTWDSAAARARFRLLLDEFETAKFSKLERPLTFGSIPWPILDNPLSPSSSSRGEAVTWVKVEAFFADVKRTCSAEEYRKLVGRAHHMFHPDKWKSRGILDTVRDPDLRKALESSGTIVAQAISPLRSRRTTEDDITF
ncbi:hypothetical protein D9615_005569 [Tricholomella constricta]|uniref:RRM domain-containing protein n=1 Tax=Tricholomella constricta TaxID=117010 RepID=A0A8H5HDS8_9AGAR|nr:hypothetical protein D9615_005569 [Tricholomella constricta]